MARWEQEGDSAEAIRAELGRIVASTQFDASDRNRKFLAYVVEETLAGRADRIKAYSVATSVFGRDERFDPQVDSIVRIEAGRLRRALERYYLTAGRDSRLRIEIPRGTYVPIFGPAASAPPREAMRQRPAVLVTTFEEEGDQSRFPSFTRGLARSLIIALTRFTGLRVFGTDAVLWRPGESENGGASRELAPDYIVTGQTSLSSDHFEVDVLLVEARTGRAVWAEGFERDLRPSDIITLRNEVANLVARAIAQPYGAIHCDRAQDSDGAAPEALGSYAAVLLFYTYWRGFDRDKIELVRGALERAVAAEPDYAEALACLSLVYSNSVRFRHPVELSGVTAEERALALAHRAVALAPRSSQGHYALGLALWFTGDPAAGIAALEEGRALNPNDTTIVADLGQRYAMRGCWERAVPLLEDAYANNPSLPGSHRIGLFLYHFAHGRHAAALEEARRVEAPGVLYGHVAVAAAAAELGLADEAAAALDAILGIDARYGENVVADLERRHVAPEFIPLIVASLKKAGLSVTAQPAHDRRRASS